jgi:BASS family bile acid:Na+ symporter
MLAAAAGSVPDLVWLYVALIQIPIYALPLIVRPLVRRLAAGKDSSRIQRGPLS